MIGVKITDGSCVRFSSENMVTWAAVRVPSARSSFNATNAGLLEISVISILSSSAILTEGSAALESSTLQAVPSKSQYGKAEITAIEPSKKERRRAESLRLRGSPSKPRRMLEEPQGKDLTEEEIQRLRLRLRQILL
jgi:hypothetical protein